MRIDVVLRVVVPDVFSSQLLQEVGLHKQVGKHPHLVNFVTACENADFVYLVTKFCNQGESPAYLARKTAVSEKDIADLFYQLILAILHCHTQGNMRHNVHLA